MPGVPAGPAGRGGIPGVAPGRAAGVRRYAEDVVPGPDGDRMVLTYSDPDAFARWIVGYGSDVVVLAPDEARKATVARLRDLIEEHVQLAEDAVAYR